MNATENAVLASQDQGRLNISTVIIYTLIATYVLAHLLPNINTYISVTKKPKLAIIPFLLPSLALISTILTVAFITLNIASCASGPLDRATDPARTVIFIIATTFAHVIIILRLTSLVQQCITRSVYATVGVCIFGLGDLTLKALIAILMRTQNARSLMFINTTVPQPINMLFACNAIAVAFDAAVIAASYVAISSAWKHHAETLNFYKMTRLQFHLTMSGSFGLSMLIQCIMLRVFAIMSSHHPAALLSAATLDLLVAPTIIHAIQSIRVIQTSSAMIFFDLRPITDHGAFTITTPTLTTMQSPKRESRMEISAPVGLRRRSLLHGLQRPTSGMSPTSSATHAKGLTVIVLPYVLSQNVGLNSIQTLQINTLFPDDRMSQGTQKKSQRLSLDQKPPRTPQMEDFYNIALDSGPGDAGHFTKNASGSQKGIKGLFARALGRRSEPSNPNINLGKDTIKGAIGEQADSSLGSRRGWHGSRVNLDEEEGAVPPSPTAIKTPAFTTLGQTMGREILSPRGSPRAAGFPRDVMNQAAHGGPSPLRRSNDDDSSESDRYRYSEEEERSESDDDTRSVYAHYENPEDPPHLSAGIPRHLTPMPSPGPMRTTFEDRRR